MSIPLTNYYDATGTDIFANITGPGQPTGATGYFVDVTNLFTYYTSQGANYQLNLSKFEYIYNGTPFDIMLYNYFSKATIGTPANATLNNINGRLCWKIKNNTTVTFRFPNATSINIVAIGGGQTGSGNGGRGGGLVRGKITTQATTNCVLTIAIGASDANTTISGTGPTFSVNANAGPNSGTQSGLTTPTIAFGGNGGSLNFFGDNGPFINDLGIFSGGGGGGQGLSGAQNPGGSAGGGLGGTDGTAGSPGTPNTGGGGGSYGPQGGSTPPGAGGSGVVYLYL
jgi:hypothetical protein